MSGFALKTAPTSYPVSAGEAKDHLGLDHDEDNAKLDRLIRRATLYGEHRLWRQFITASWYLYLDSFPAIIELRDKLPIASIVAITYTDEDGDTQTLSSSLYQTDIVNPNKPGMIAPEVNQAWPTIQSGVFNPVRVEFTAGYGTAEDVPETTIHGILMKVHDLYELTGSEIPGASVNQFSQTADSLFDATAWGVYG